ncbi:MAG TPA: DNA primase [Xanthomonadales bacterium]|nr:DNA primase [Xanthomonadales bacterium]
MTASPTGPIPDDFIDALVARTDIVELIGSRVPLKQAGREFVGLCPFHDERSPSFSVSPNKQFFHCFGCGAHGTAIGFLMQYDRLEFLDAIEELAKRAGMEVPRDTRHRHRRDDFDALVAICAEAEAFFRRQFDASPKAQAYLQRRGVDAGNRARFGIGYAPAGWDGLLRSLGGSPERQALLEKAGLLSRKDGGSVYDKFRDRLMFPIHDRRGRPIAFGGRILSTGQDDGPKYLNSPETPLFHKGRELYGLWQVRKAHSRIGRLIVVEGYMDVVALFQYGIDTAVATLGTATTPDQADLLFRNSSDVYFCFDGDRAGRQAAWRALQSVLPRLREGRQAFFLFLPEGQDPDSLIREEGAAGFDARLREATPCSDYFFDELSRDIALRTLDGKARLAERAKPLLARIPEGAFRDLMEQRLTSLTGLAQSIGETRQPVTARTSLPGNRRRSLVRSAIALLLQQPALALEVTPPFAFADLRQPGVDLLILLIERIQARPNLTTGALLDALADHPQAASVRTLALTDIPGTTDAQRQEFLGAIARLGQQTADQRIAELTEQQRQVGLDDQQKTELRVLLSRRLERP